jgi:hypothetical protein
LFIIESPRYTRFSSPPNSVNWTATYRSDSDIVLPSGKWVYYDPHVTTAYQAKNYAANKTKQVAWLISHCDSKPTNRLQYGRELQKFIGVDIYGKCGNMSCPKGHKKCRQMLDNDYKFYLAFENSNCNEYITEKFFFNGLR